ncbi:MAG: CPBP family intramembrane metalloprotease [Sporocytophaga sp.]|uniref:CPBP family intramembrane glutamic endopeptidase n=1 Tax=Sporocytophaga sp. TaxID=2231183 RepID=UPI001B091080|nr:CPBP family intramembrane glutamic endopeptidase [Sporocytophaga sp.]MBO9701164.1 CPBP family intramembrane metalloprotease [Sporocytophaga sp.]
MLILFLGSSLAFNYSFDFENSILEKYAGQKIYNVYLFLFYSVPLLFLSLAYAYFYDRKLHLRSLSYWFTILFVILILIFSETSFYLYRDWIRAVIPIEISQFISSFVSELISSSIIIVPILGYWYWVDRKSIPLYGFQKNSLDLAPYLWLLLLMAPFILWASFQQDFLNYYPEYKPSLAENYLGWPYWATFGIHEIFYGMGFLSIEFLFRGFLVLAMIKYLDKGAVFIMVALYCYLHFGKPLGEAVGSIFGGTILGIITYYSRSIWGGLLIHLGIAYLMDLFAVIQHLLKNHF